MRKLLTLVGLLICLSTYAQQGKFEPFKLIVLRPDTAIIEKSLFQYRDSITQTQIKRYYRTVKTYEGMANCKACDFEKEDIERYKNMVVDLKKLEPEVQKFKYFELLSSYSTEMYNFYFNEYEPYSTIMELPNQDTELASLKLLAENTKTDYIIFFTKIRTTVEAGMPVLYLTTSLYSKKENKILLTRETTGDTSSRGEMWTCGNPLSCLLINGVRTSTKEVADVLRNLQLRK